MRAVLLDNHPNDSRVTVREDGIVQALTSRCGTGGGNVPMVMIEVDDKQDEKQRNYLCRGFTRLLGESCKLEK